MSDCGSVSSVDGVQSSHSSGALVSDENRKLVGALGATVSATAGVATDSVLLSFLLPNWSRTVTANVCVVPGARSSTVTPLKPIRSKPYGLPSTSSVYQTWLVLSVDGVHETETRVGQTPFDVSVGALGGVVSGGVVCVTTLLV